MSPSSITASTYRESFPKPDLTPTIGVPTFESPHKMHRELKINVASVHSNLRGGTNGLLGLMLSPERYALITHIPFERPEHPGHFQPPANAPRAVVEAEERIHKENLRVSHEVLEVEKLS